MPWSAVCGLNGGWCSKTLACFQMAQQSKRWVQKLLNWRASSWMISFVWILMRCAQLSRMFSRIPAACSNQHAAGILENILDSCAHRIRSEEHTSELQL